jgi:hypothetical protein
VGYYYRVDAERRVREPQFGPRAYRTDTKRMEIPFGKGQEIKTGREALEVAMGKAQELLEVSSSVSVWRLTNAGNGQGTYLKQSDALFDKGWSEVQVGRVATS